MSEQEWKSEKKYICIGLLAHVDAGKTSLLESLLFQCHAISKKGRVDHQTSFLDFDQQERHRGITIYNKQVILPWKDCEFTVLDTPGHIDFSMEMEQALQVMDYAILVINAMNPIQVHTQTIVKLLKKYHVPIFIFVNKMDASYQDEACIIKQIQENLLPQCVWMNQEQTDENIAMNKDWLLEEYIQYNQISITSLQQAILKQEIVPCYFGSALKQEGIEDLLQGLHQFSIMKTYDTVAKAQVFKINYDEQGNRLTHVKVIGDKLLVKQVLQNEKIDQIRRYHGDSFTLLSHADAGMICALKGLKESKLGQILGCEETLIQPILFPYLNYQVEILDETSSKQVFQYLQQLEEEFSQLNPIYYERQNKIQVQLYGEVQAEVLQQIIWDRFHVKIVFVQNHVIYLETISKPCIGIACWEMKKQYAQVQLLLEPAKLNTGIQIEVASFVKDVATAWILQVMSYIQESKFVGTLSGASLTDIKITILQLKVNKHTNLHHLLEVVKKAMYQGLLQVPSILLEPYFSYSIGIDEQWVGKVMQDMEKMKASCKIEKQEDKQMVLVGEASISHMQNYGTKLYQYGNKPIQFWYEVKGYQECNNLSNIQNPYDFTWYQQEATSVLQIKNESQVISWDQIHSYIPPIIDLENKTTTYQNENSKGEINSMNFLIPRNQGATHKYSANQKPQTKVDLKNNYIYKERCILIDGYNVMYASETLSKIAKEDLHSARLQLIQMMQNYQGYKQCVCILVFDAYNVEQGKGSLEKHGNLHVVYTKQAQTADTYIEKATHRLASDYNLTVVTSDAAIQLISIAQGAFRQSSKEMLKELEYLNERGISTLSQTGQRPRVHLLDSIKQYDEEDF